MKKCGLNANTLKLLAVLSMTLDHIGLLMFPQALWLRAVGRLAFPIFAFMIAEGCSHTRNMGKYLLTVGISAALCQAVSYIATGSLYQCILVTFSLSIGFVWLLTLARKAKPLYWLLGFIGIGAVYFITDILPGLLTGTDFAVDYGFLGVMLPVAIFLCRNKWQKLLIAAVLLVLQARTALPVQWYALLSLPLLALYNGTRGKWKMKWFFYIYYPAHLAVLYVIAPFLA